MTDSNNELQRAYDELLYDRLLYDELLRDASIEELEAIYNSEHACKEAKIAAEYYLLWA